MTAELERRKALVSMLGLMMLFLSVGRIMDLGLADDINLDIPRFKGGDCVVWTPPMQQTSAMAKIKQLNSLTFRGQSTRYYEVEIDNDQLNMQTWQFDIGKTRKIDCKEFEKIKSEVEKNNKAIKDAEKARQRAIEESESTTAALSESLPGTQIKTTGTASSNPYWGRVEAIIKRNWEPPPIEVIGTNYVTVIRFRMYRNGTVKEVSVQQSSGNSYFDQAASRAILKQPQFPVFPSDMTDAYQDAEMVFNVGEDKGKYSPCVSR